MKRILFFLLLFVCLQTQAQYERKSSSKGGDFGMSTSVKTGETLSIDGKTFDIWETKTGSRFVKNVSKKTGKLYPIWLGQETGELFEGKAVRKSKHNTYFIIELSEKTGQPKVTGLDKN